MSNSIENFRCIQCHLKDLSKCWRTESRESRRREKDPKKRDLLKVILCDEWHKKKHSHQGLLVLIEKNKMESKPPKPDNHFGYIFLHTWRKPWLRSNDSSSIIIKCQNVSSPKTFPQMTQSWKNILKICRSNLETGKI